MQNVDAASESFNAPGGKDMGDIASEFERLLGQAALKLWPHLPRDVQELLFETAVPVDPHGQKRIVPNFTFIRPTIRRQISVFSQTWPMGVT
jgi:hypothetical protein